VPESGIALGSLSGVSAGETGHGRLVSWACSRSIIVGGAVSDQARWRECSTEGRACQCSCAVPCMRTGPDPI
jgi:hypothetical protein